MNIVSDRDGSTEGGKFVASGTSVTYLGHVPLGAVLVQFEDGSTGVMDANCFAEFR